MNDDKTLRVIKYNDGEGALLCNECNEVLATGVEHTDCVHLCGDCYKQFKEDQDWCMSYR